MAHGADPPSVVRPERRVKRQPLIGPVTRILLRMLATLAVIGMIAIGYGAWRLSQGPLRLALLDRMIAVAVSDPGSGRHVSLRDSTIAYDPATHRVVVAAHEVRVTDADERLVLFAPELRTGLALRPLIAGRVIPETLTLRHPVLRLRRTGDGAIQVIADATPDIGAASTGPDAADDDQGALSQTALADFATALTGDGHDARGLAAIRMLRIEDGLVLLDNGPASPAWAARSVQANLQRDGTRTTALGEAELDLGSGPAPVELTVAAQAPFHAYDVQISARGLNPGALMLRLGQLAEPLRLNAPIDLTLRVAFSTDTGLGDAALSVGLGSGTAEGVPIEPRALAIDGGRIEARWEQSAKRLTLTEASLKTGSVTLSASATIDDPQSATVVAANVRANEVPVDSLPKLWPPGLAPNPRAWIADNLSRGTIHEAAAAVTLQRENGELALKSLAGTIAMDGMRVRYMDTLPPVEDATATGTLDPDSVRLTLTEGHALGLKLTAPITVDITGLSGTDHRIAVDVGLAGPLADALRILNAPRLGYISRFGLDPGAVGGTARARLNFQFPLLATLPFSKVGLRATAELADVAVPKAFRGQAVTQGDFAVTLDSHHFDATGTARIADTPITAAWTENFDDRTDIRRRFVVGGTFAEAARKVLRFDEGDRVEGALGATLDYREFDGGGARLAANVDAEPARINLGEVGWIKSPRTPASVRLDATLQNGSLVRLDAIELTAPDFTASGRIGFGPNSRVERAEFSRIRGNGTDLSAVAARRGEDGWDVELNGAALNLAPMLASDDKTEPDQTSDPTPSFPLTARLAIDRVELGKDRVLDKVRGALDVTPELWNRLDVAAEAAGHPISVTLVPEGGMRHFVARTNDLGALTRVLGVSKSVRGGALKLEGSFPRPGFFDGSLAVDSFRIADAPVLARLLAVASITGLPELMSGDGIAFDSFTAKLARSPSATTIQNGRGTGNALNFTVRGTIDRPTQLLNLDGAIVPLGGLNRVIDAIPLVGDLVTGGRGEGLFAWTYQVTGRLDDPKISVNPLSALAPSALRALFDGANADIKPPPNTDNR